MGIFLIFVAVPWLLSFLLAGERVNGWRIFLIQTILTFILLIFSLLPENSGAATYSEIGMIANTLLVFISGIILLIRLSFAKAEPAKK